MTAPSAAESELQTRASRVVERVVGVAPARVTSISGGLTNVVFAAETARGPLVVRLGPGDDKHEAFTRERRAVASARAAAVPVASIVAVGRDGEWAYSVAERADGMAATAHADPALVLDALGRLAAVIHTVRTVGHGHTFALADEGLDGPGASWPDFLHRELDAAGRLDRLRREGVIADAQHDALAETLERVARWDAPAVLQHGDLRLKNVLVDGSGAITALVDWDNCLSAVGPHWDISVALHDLAIDAKQSFLAGYGMPEAEVRRAAPVWRLFNVLNYAPELDRLLAAGDHAGVERLRTRLSGALDLFGA